MIRSEIKFENVEKRDAAVQTLLTQEAFTVELRSLDGKRYIQVNEKPSSLLPYSGILVHGLFVTRTPLGLRLRGEPEHIRHFQETILPMLQ